MNIPSFFYHNFKTEINLLHKVNVNNKESDTAIYQDIDSDKSGGKIIMTPVLPRTA